LLEFRVLHLQFDLVDLQFVEQPPGVGLRLGISGLSPPFALPLTQLSFGVAAQLGGIG
jgi:hypothetical protein